MCLPKKNARRRLIVGAVVFLLLAVVLAQRFRSSHVFTVEFCTRCGLRCEVDTARSPAEQQEETSVSQWYERYISQPHKHRWKIIRSHGEKHGFFVTHSWVRHNWDYEPFLAGEEVIGFLELLREHGLSAHYFQLLSGDDRDARLKAWQVTQVLGHPESDEVKAWWSKLEAVLAQRAPQSADSSR